MYFRTKTVKGTPLVQLVESYRNSRSQPRQRVIASLGDAPLPEDAQTNKAPTMIRRHQQNTQTEDPINLLLKHGLAEGLPQIAEMLMNAAMLIERNAHLCADPYERNEARNGYANGLKDRGFHSSVGPLALRVPQT
jgi:hypothetical protein